MIDFADSEMFSPLEHQSSDVTLHVLSERVAPVQQGFYFVNNSITDDERYLWFYCAFPPSPGHNLGVVDFESGEVRCFPETQFSAASPHVDPETGEAYWASGRTVWKRGPQEDAEVEWINAIPEELIGQRRIHRPVTHLTPSADGEEFFIDASFGLQQVFGSLPLDGSDFEMWHRFDRNFNHAQFSPTDPDRVLFAQEFHRDPITGFRLPITDRMWVMDRGEAPRPIMPEPTVVSHEWWDPDGEHVWCVNGNETWRVDVETGEVYRIEFPYHCWHSHSSADGQFVVCDSNTEFYRGCPSSVHFLNRKTGEKLTLIENPERDDYAGRNYHIDPHPRFCCNDRYVVFTTTVGGRVDVVVVPTQHLVEKTQ